MANNATSRGWGIVKLLILTSSCWRSQEDCTPDLNSIANLNRELFCTDIDPENDMAGQEELSLNCTGSSYLISRNIPHDYNSIEFIRAGIVCGPSCDTKLLDLSTAVVSGQVNITNATNCIVAGCYEARLKDAGSIQFLFHPLICMLEPELAMISVSTISSTLANEATTGNKFHTASNNNNLIVPELATSEVSISTSSSTLANKATTESVVVTQQLMIGMDSAGVAEVAAITLSVLLLSIFATLIVVAVIAIFFGVKYWRNENRSYLSQLYLKSMNYKDDIEYDDHLDINPGKIEAPETKSISAQSLFLALQSPATLHVAESNEYIRPSVQSEALSSLSQMHLEAEDVLTSLASVQSLPELVVSQEGRDYEEISSPVLDQSISHNEEAELEAANKDLSLEGESQLPNYQHSNGYIETIPEKLMVEELAIPDVQYEDENLTSSNEPITGFVDVSNGSGEFQVAGSYNAEDNCPVVFEFGACSEGLEDDGQLFSPGQEACSTAIAFDFSSSLHDAQEHHLATLLEAMDPDNHIQTQDSIVSDDSIAIGYVKYKTTEAGYIIPLSSEKPAL